MAESLHTLDGRRIAGIGSGTHRYVALKIVTARNPRADRYESILSSENPYDALDRAVRFGVADPIIYDCLERKALRLP